MGFRYFTEETSDNFVFFRIPKVFFKDENFKSLCTDSKVLYGLMLDRMGLSRKTDGTIKMVTRTYIIRWLLFRRIWVYPTRPYQSA